MCGHVVSGQQLLAAFPAIGAGRRKGHVPCSPEKGEAGEERGRAVYPTVRHQGLTMNRTLCLVPPTVIPCLGLTGEMFSQTWTTLAKLVMDFEGFGCAVATPRPRAQGASHRREPCS